MSAPRYAPCRCSHGKDWHERDGLAPQCTHTGCTCLAYRPNVPARPDLQATTTPIRPAEPTTPAVQGQRGPTIDQVLAAGKRSEFKRTVALAERIAVLVHDLRGRLTDERQAAEAKRQQDAVAEAAKIEIAELEARLKAARAKLKTGNGGTPPQRHEPACRHRRARLHRTWLRPDVRHHSSPRDAPAARARRLRPARHESRVSR